MKRIRPDECLFPDIVSTLTRRDPPQIFVLGGGKSGQAAVSLIRKLGLEPIGFDDRATAGTDFQRTPTLDSSIFPHSGPAILVISPGVALSHPLCQAARQCGIPLISETELGLAFLPNTTTVLGVTGTNGKSTVVHATRALIAAHFERSESPGKNAVALGNIGTPVSTFVASEHHADVVVLELSSYQLETMTRRVFHSAAITNLTADHLARYKNIRSYLLAKWRISSLIRPQGRFALGEDVANLALQEGLTLSTDLEITVVGPQRESHLQPVSVSLPGAFQASLFRPFSPYWLEPSAPFPQKFDLNPASNEVRYTMNDRHGMTIHMNDLRMGRDSHVISDPIIRGVHNAENLSFCCFFERGLFPATKSHLRQVFGSGPNGYQPLAHRQEPVAIRPDLPFKVVNDSKSTSFVCTAMALRCYPHRVHLLIGGALKDDPVSDLLPSDARVDFASVSCFGPKATWLAKEFETLTGIQPRVFPSLQEATLHSLSIIGQGETLLLSPGAASFDAYANFEERGDHFRQIVLSALG